MHPSEKASRLATALLLLEAAQWPPPPESLPCAEEIARKVIQLSEKDENWMESILAKLHQELAQGNPQASIVRNYLRKHGVVI